MIDPSDNVAVALKDIPGGAEVAMPGGGRLIAASDIPYSHKMAIVALDEGDPVIKYGEVIGRAATRLVAGDWVHTHNMKSVGEAE